MGTNCIGRMALFNVENAGKIKNPVKTRKYKFK